MPVTSKPFPPLSTVYRHTCTLGSLRFFRSLPLAFSQNQPPDWSTTLLLFSHHFLAWLFIHRHVCFVHYRPFLEMISYYISVQNQSQSSCLQDTLLQAVNIARWNVVKKFLRFYHKKYISSILNCREANKYQQNKWIKIRH